MRLLTPPDGNVKIRKNRIPTYGLSLAPHRMAGQTSVCPSSTVGCRATCLVFSGLSAVFPRIMIRRIEKTKWFHADQPAFLRQLNREIGQAVRLHGRKVAFRLNVFSDIDFENLPDSPVLGFPRTQFYDYTKISQRYANFLRGDFPTHYHLTFSRSEKNEPECLDFLARGGTVSLVRASDEARNWYRGYPIVSGDSTDFRPDDPPSHWLSLLAKGSKKTKETAKRTEFAVA